VRTGKTPVLSAQEVRDLVDGIETDTVIGLRDRALIGTMVYTFARVGANHGALRSARRSGEAGRGRADRDLKAATAGTSR
jgi:hypothetical protein